MPTVAFDTGICLASGLPAFYSSIILSAIKHGSFLHMDPAEAQLFIDQVISTPDPGLKQNLQQFLTAILDACKY
jgi:hypothetical protein